MFPPQPVATFTCRSWRTSVAALAIVGYVASVVGYPAMPARHGPLGVAYPCEHHRCGCASAEHCWRDCCCFTLDERLAWAARRDVAPPAEIAPRKAAVSRSHSAPRPCCASTSSVCHAVEHGPSQRALSDCEPRPSKSCCAKTENKRVAPIRWIVGIQARGCHGEGTHWIAFSSPIAPPPPRVSWQPHAILTSGFAGLSLLASQAAHAPPTRPG
jgi:hypothetical protein